MLNIISVNLFTNRSPSDIKIFLQKTILKDIFSSSTLFFCYITRKNQLMSTSVIVVQIPLSFLIERLCIKAEHFFHEADPSPSPLIFNVCWSSPMQYLIILFFQHNAAAQLLFISSEAKWRSSRSFFNQHQNFRVMVHLQTSRRVTQIKQETCGDGATAGRSMPRGPCNHDPSMRSVAALKVCRSLLSSLFASFVRWCSERSDLIQTCQCIQVINRCYVWPVGGAGSS